MIRIVSLSQVTAEWSLPVLTSTQVPFTAFSLPCAAEEGSDEAASPQCHPGIQLLGVPLSWNSWFLWFCILFIGIGLGFTDFDNSNSGEIVLTYLFVQTLVCAKHRLFLWTIVSVLLHCGTELFHLCFLSLGERVSERMGRGKGI